MGGELLPEPLIHIILMKYQLENSLEGIPLSPITSMNSISSMCRAYKEKNDRDYALKSRELDILQESNALMAKKLEWRKIEIPAETKGVGSPACSRVGDDEFPEGDEQLARDMANKE